MKKLLLALALFIAPATAFAQCSGVFSANRVCGTVAGGVPGQIPFSSIPSALIVGSTTISGDTTNHAVLFNNSGVLGADASLQFTTGNALVISPTALTNNSALNITQSTPNGGSVAGPINGNLITFIDGTQTVTGGFPVDQWGQITNQTDAFRINYRVTGGSANHFGSNVVVDVTGTNGGVGGAVSSIGSSVAATITGDWWSNIAAFRVGPTTNLNQTAIGYEAEALVATGGVILNRIGFSANSQGPVGASGIDAAFVVDVATFNAAPYNGAASWGNGIYFSNNLYGAGQFPILSTGNIILADTGTVANFVSAHTLTVTGNILDFPFAQMTGPGSLTLGSGSAATSNLIQVRCATCGAAEIFGNANGTAGSDELLTQDSSGNNILVAGVQEAGNTSSEFGQTTGNWGRLVAAGSTNAGLLIGTTTSVPVIIGANNTNRIEVFSSGCVSVGTTTDCGAAGIVNLLTGLRIGNAATTGNVLRGNGTNFVSAQLSCADLSTPCITGNSTLTFGTHLTGTSYNGSSPVTIATDAVSTNTASTLVTRDGSGNFSAGTITASLTGHASLDLALTGGTMSGAIAMGTNAITGLTTLACAGSCTFQSNGSTFAGSINTSQQVLFGTNTTAPSGGTTTGPTLTLTRNTTTLPTVSTFDPMLQLAAADTLGTNVVLQSFGTAFGGIRYAQARGTAASRTAVQSGDIIGGNNAYGYQTVTPAYSPGAGFFFVATENYTATANGTRVDIYGTANGSTFPGSASVSIGAGLMVNTTTDPGAGSIQVNTTIIAPNLTSDAGLTDTTLCWKNSATTGTFLKGSGTLGICLGTSGRQFKTAFVPMVAGMDEIAKVKLWNYRYLPGFGDDGERIQYGPSAQDVEMAIPDLVRYDNRGRPINYDIGAFVPISMHALQQLNERITRLEQPQ